MRSTVVEPDGSWRPSVEQEAEGLARVSYPDDDAIAARVNQALADAGIEATAELSRDHAVTLHGKATSTATLERAAEIVEAVSGVTSVVNRMVVGA